MLGAHVEDHPLAFVDTVIEDVVVIHHPAELFV